MKISDEQLSAFLDAELPEDEMEMIRQGISEDESLANRLADLAMVDEQVARHYARIDEHPMPAAVSRLLDEDSKPATNVIAFPARKKLPGFQRYAAVAACAAVLMGIGVVQWLPTDQAARDWNAIAQVLEQNPSGSEQSLADGSQVKPRLTFINKRGDYCRQFQLMERENATENIACRTNNQWELVTRVEQGTRVAGDYQPASGGSKLDDALDEMIEGEAFDAIAEQRAIEQHWPNHTHAGETK
jgi:hypothetical protein